MSVSVSGLTKSYEVRRGSEPVAALRGIDVEVADGELLTILGPSGSGKSTLLRCVAGLESPDEGRVAVGGRDVTELPPGERDVAMVFQELALFPHLNVRENVVFGLRARKVPRPEIEHALERAGRMLDLESLLDRRPTELSGGERQRVALARAVVRQPRAFLLDEPLSDLDAAARARTRADVKSVQRSLATTMLYVTHDQSEALTLGDRVAVLRAGRIEQIGAPAEIYDRPATAFVAGFVGTPPMNVLPGGLAAGGGGSAGIRPENVALVAPGAGRFDAEVALVEQIGGDTIVHLRVREIDVLAKAAGPAPEHGATVGVDFADGDVHRFDDGGARVP